MSNPALKATRRRKIIQWALAPLVFITIGLGWKYPLIGFVVPVAMIAGIVGGVSSGRYVCGNLCPRGGFFDRVMAPLSPARPIPAFLRAMPFRWVVFSALMGFMAWRIAADPANVYHWGSVFWLMCTVTTALGVALALAVHPRGWCSFCPVGTASNALGGHKDPITIDASACRECGLCEKSCPIAIGIIRHKSKGVLADRDCVKCGECVAKCPARALD